MGLSLGFSGTPHPSLPESYIRGTVCQAPAGQDRGRDGRRSAPLCPGAFLGAADAQGRDGAGRKLAPLRFDAALLARVDRAARRRGVSRSAWVAFTLSKALDDEEATGS
jgi:hypothetical protein